MLIVLVGIVAIIGVTAVAANRTDRIPRGTSVAGVNLGGLSPRQAEDLVRRTVAPRARQDTVVVAGDRTVRVKGTATGVAVDVEATVDRARSVLHNGALLSRLFGRGGQVEPVLVVRESVVGRKSKAVAARLSTPVREGALDFAQGRARPVLPRTGTLVEAAQVREALLASATATNHRFAVTTREQRPTLTDDQVRAAANTLGAVAVSGPLGLRVTATGANPVDQSLTLSVKDFAPFLRTTVTDGALALAVDGPGLIASLAQDLSGVQRTARDATFTITNGKPVVVPSVVGRTLDPVQVSESVADALANTGPRVATVGLVTTPPALTTAQAQKLGVVERLSTFRQKFPYAPYRYQNIGQAAARVNGTLLLPGEVFSLNRIVKERTPENGYTKGFVISGGRLTEDLGGGVSTMATATWHAAFFAGLERIEQRAHSFYISRYQPGLEATVAWGQLDLKFRNDSPHAVFITAVRGTNFVRVSMYGTKRYDISADSGPRTNVRSYRTRTDSGTDCTPQSGSEGFTIVVTRIFRQAGKIIKREPLQTVYNPADDITCQKPTPSPTPSVSATAKPTPKPTG